MVHRLSLHRVQLVVLQLNLTDEIRRGVSTLFDMNVNLGCSEGEIK